METCPIRIINRLIEQRKNERKRNTTRILRMLKLLTRRMQDNRTKITHSIETIHRCVVWFIEIVQRQNDPATIDLYMFIGFRGLNQLRTSSKNEVISRCEKYLSCFMSNSMLVRGSLLPAYQLKLDCLYSRFIFFITIVIVQGKTFNYDISCHLASAKCLCRTQQIQVRPSIKTSSNIRVRVQPLHSFSWCNYAHAMSMSQWHVVNSFINYYRFYAFMRAAHEHALKIPMPVSAFALDHQNADVI